MKKSFTITLAIIGIAFMLISFGMSYDILSGNGKSGKTNSPGEGNCTSCHNSFAVNTGGGSTTITSPDLTGWNYTPGVTYTINVTVAKSAMSLFGFDFEALLPSGANAGTLAITNATQTQLKATTISSNSRNNVVHQSNGGTSSNTHTFSFHWTAPTAGTGNITFYVSGLACNNDGGTSGDYTYTSSQVVTETTTGITDAGSNHFQISVFPNPTTENCTLHYELTENSKVSIDLISLTGKFVKNIINTQKNAGVNDQTINFDSSFARGTYFIKIQINGETHVEPVIIQ